MNEVIDKKKEAKEHVLCTAHNLVVSSQLQYLQKSACCG